MKKMVILASAMMMVCGLQAASYVWGFYNTEVQTPAGGYFGETAGYDDATAYLFIGTVGVVGDKLDFSNAQLVTSTTMDAQNWNWGSFDTGAMPSSELVNSAGGQSYSLILLDSGSIADYEKYTGNYVLAPGESKGGVIPGTDGNIEYANFINSDSIASNAWKSYTGAAPIPEPTSGLLLLLGMAGLALKRKRA